MNPFVKTITGNSVELAVKGLKFIPGLSKEEFEEALSEIQEQLENAKATYEEATTQSTEATIVSMVHDGLEIAHAACDAAGATKADKFFEMGEAVLANFEENPEHPYAAAIKAWFQKTFGKKVKTEEAS